MRLWKTSRATAVSTGAQVSSARMLAAMICCMMFLGAEGGELEQHSGPQIVLVVLLLVLGGLVLYEIAKWMCWEVYREWTPGASARKLRRLEKLRDATSRAIRMSFRKAGSVSRSSRTHMSSASRTLLQESSQPTRSMIREALSRAPQQGEPRRAHQWSSHRDPQSCGH